MCVRGVSVVIRNAASAVSLKALTQTRRDLCYIRERERERVRKEKNEREMWRRRVRKKGERQTERGEDQGKTESVDNLWSFSRCSVKKNSQAVACP